MGTGYNTINTELSWGFALLVLAFILSFCQAAMYWAGARAARPKGTKGSQSKSSGI